jgi:hypothetical protein
VRVESNPAFDEPLTYKLLGDEDYQSQLRIDVIRIENMMRRLNDRKALEEGVCKVESTELLNLLLAHVCGGLSVVVPFSEAKLWDAKQHAAYIAACAHWPENLKSEPVQMLRLVA